jgi:2',3'-cyclic-nucleotide 2'-phosphodiesterase (5'-nucleotidase family)
MRALVSGADLAITNSGGLRANLPEGPLTYGRLYELMPFDNLRTVISLTGAELRAVIAENVTRVGSRIVLSGVRATAACNGGRVNVVLVRDSGRPIRDDDVLKVVTTDFLITGGDSFFTPVAPVHVESTGGPIREEIAEMLTREGGTWGAERRSLPPRIQLQGTRPLACAAP